MDHCSKKGKINRSRKLENVDLIKIEEKNYDDLVSPAPHDQDLLNELS